MEVTSERRAPGYRVWKAKRYLLEGVKIKEDLVALTRLETREVRTDIYFKV